ncbi:MAG: sigma 54-interacting transcriptional regulator [Bdellovibrionales bacterium]
MLTTKIKIPNKSQSVGFLCWDKGGHIESREVKNFLSIGRESTNLLSLEDHFVSRHHARIEKDTSSGFFILKDMQSRNGVFLNKNRIYKAVLSHNDKIQIGNLQFTFSFEKYNHKWKLSAQSLNQKWNEQLSRIPHIAQTNCPILILGPSGTGKEVLAQTIHKASSRNQSPLVSVNCSALTETLVESELFGHTKGSYTDAIKDRKGAFLAASKGTLFLDEIGDLPLKLQPKFLRAIEYQEIKPVGSDLTLKTDVRIISATHQNLKSKAEENEFRKDLYYRLNVISIPIPALKDRMEDFESLLNSFTLKEGVTFSTKAIEILKSYHWPGNIRELKNMVARSKALFTNETIDSEKVSFLLDQGEKEESSFTTLKGLEKTAITNSLKRFKGNQSKVANALDIPRSTLHNRIQEHEINVNKFKRS